MRDGERERRRGRPLLRLRDTLDPELRDLLRGMLRPRPRSRLNDGLRLLPRLNDRGRRGGGERRGMPCGLAACFAGMPSRDRGGGD